jgi:multidrug resistance efflux pump
MHEAQTTDGRRSGKRRIISFVLMGAVLLLATGGSYYYAHTQSFESTDDAFIEGNVTDLAPKIAGRVDRVLIDDNQHVKEGRSFSHDRSTRLRRHPPAEASESR